MGRRRRRRRDRVLFITLLMVMGWFCRDGYRAEQLSTGPITRHPADTSYILLTPFAASILIDGHSLTHAPRKGADCTGCP